MLSNRSSYATLVILLVILFELSQSTTPIIANNSDYTTDCIEKANGEDCNIFNKCCEFRCRQYRRRQFCMALFGEIQSTNTHCLCISNSASTELIGANHRKRRSSKMDAFTAVILLFVSDMLMLAFAF